MPILTYALVRINDGHVLAGQELWECVDVEEPDRPVVTGLYDDTGTRIHLLDGSWTFLRDDITPPFLQG